MAAYYSKGRGYWCSSCQRSFLDEAAIEHHFMESLLHYWCCICEKHFSSRTNLANHEATVHRFLDCTSCRKRFASQAALDSHNIAKHPVLGGSHRKGHLFSQKGSEQREAAVHPLFSCSGCNEKFHDQIDRDHHDAMEHGCSVCIDCRKDFKSLVDVANHAIKTHGSVRCTGCAKRFKYLADIVHHQREAHDVCLRCQRQFVNQAGLTGHLTNSSSHAWCVTCKKDFVAVDKLLSHEKSVHFLCGGSCLFRGGSYEKLCRHWTSEGCHKFCHLCDSASTGWLSEAQLSSHISIVHPNQPRKPHPAPLPPSWFSSQTKAVSPIMSRSSTNHVKPAGKTSVPVQSQRAIIEATHARVARSRPVIQPSTTTIDQPPWASPRIAIEPRVQLPRSTAFCLPVEQEQAKSATYQETLDAYNTEKVPRDPRRDMATTTNEAGSPISLNLLAYRSVEPREDPSEDSDEEPVPLHPECPRTPPTGPLSNLDLFDAVDLSKPVTTTAVDSTAGDDNSGIFSKWFPSTWSGLDFLGLGTPSKPSLRIASPYDDVVQSIESLTPVQTPDMSLPLTPTKITATAAVGGKENDALAAYRDAAGTYASKHGLKNPITCWASCGLTCFSVSALITHFESGLCHSRVDVKELYQAAALCESCHQFVHGRYLLDLELGRDVQEKYKGNAYPFMCPQEGCEDVFRKLSELMDHIEGMKCPRGQRLDEGAVKELLDNLRYRLAHGIL